MRHITFINWLSIDSKYLFSYIRSQPFLLKMEELTEKESHELEHRAIWDESVAAGTSLNQPVS